MTLAINDLTAGPDAPPMVEVLATDLDPAVATITAWRLVGGFEQRVSGIIKQPVAGAGNWVDYEVPAQAATYKLELFDSAGVPLGYSDPVTVELGFTGCWMHAALAPTTAVRVQMTADAAKKLSRPVPGSIVRPRGRRVGIAVTSPRQGLQGLVLDVFAPDFQTADKIQSFLGTQTTTLSPVICVRFGVDIPAGRRIASPLFLMVSDIPEEPFDAYDDDGLEGTVQPIVGDEAARPAPGIFIPLLRRKDVNAFYASRAAHNAAYLTRLAANRDYGLAGYGGP